MVNTTIYDKFMIACVTEDSSFKDAFQRIPVNCKKTVITGKRTF